MASKTSVTMTLAGDEKKLTDAFERVGKSSQAMADKVDRSGRDVAATGKRFEDLAERSDTVDTRAMGFRDTITGVSDSLKGFSDSSLSAEERLLTLGMGIGDFASGLTNLVIPAIGNLATHMQGPLTAAMTFVSAHPLLITVGLLAAAFVLLWTQSDRFREIVTNAFQVAGKFAREVFGTAIDWITGAWNGLIGFFESLPGKIARGLSGLGEAVAGAFKFALNMAIGYLNFWVDRANNLIHGINVINPFEDIPPIPHVARLHSGGVFHASGGEGLALLRDGERVSAPGQGGAAVVEVRGSSDLAEIIQGWFNDGTLVLVGR